MKKFKLIVPSFIAIIFCMLLIAGSTFALFTSEAKADISVTSGKVKITAELDDEELKLYSANAVELATYNAAEANDKAGQITEGNYAGNYLFALQDEKFANGGTATLAADGGSLAVEKMTPGDKVVAKLAIDNQSNVNIKYRVVMTTSYTFGTGVNAVTYNQALASKLKVTIGGTQKQGLVSYQSEWVELDNGADPASALDFVLEFPLEAGNDYQDGGVKYNFVVEAVQANAATSGSELFDTIEYVPAKSSKEVAADNELPTQVEVRQNEEDLTETPIVKVSVPKSAAAAGDKVELNVSDIFVEKSETTADSKVSMTIDLKINDVQIDENNALDQEDAVTVEIFVGTGLSDVKLYHNDVLVDGAVYSPSTGIITCTATHFSPFRIEGDFAAAVTVGINAPVLYATIKDAVDAASAAATAATIELFRDETISAPLDANKSFTLNGNGHKITAKTGANRMMWIDSDDVTVTINDLNFDGANIAERALQVNTNLENCGYILNNVDIRNISMYAINYCSYSTNLSLVMDHCYVAGWGAVNLWSYSYQVTIKNSTLVGLNDKDYNAEGWNDFATVILEGDTTGQTTEGSESIYVNIINTTIIAKQTTGNEQYCIGFNENSVNNIVDLEDCTLVFDFDENTFDFYNYGEDNELYIDGIEAEDGPIGGGEAMEESEGEL